MPRPKQKDEVTKKTVEYQSDSESFLGSPKATSTPISEVDEKFIWKRTPCGKNETILAGYTRRISTTIYDEDHSFTNSSFVHSMCSLSEYRIAYEDFKECLITGEWSNFFCKHHLRILFMLLIIMILYSSYVFLTPPPASFHRKEMWTGYQKELKILRKNYSGLTKADINTLQVVGTQWIMDEQSAPAVLTVGGPNSGSFVEQLLNIAVKIANEKSRRSVISDDKVNRAWLHEKIKSELESSKNPSAAVRRIEELLWDAQLVIHAFTDNDSFPISNSLILLSVEDVSFTKGSCESDINEQLTKKWILNGGNVDNVPPIISRILGYTICL